MGAQGPPLDYTLTLGWAPKDPREAGSDNPKAITPAGRVHCTMADWARFITVHVDKQLASTLLGITESTWEAMHKRHEPSNSDYCRGGFIWCKRGWQSGNLCITHMGSNTLNKASVWATEGKASLVFTNHGAGDAAIDNAHGVQIGMF